MKIINRISGALMVICIMMILNPMTVEAASGRIRFNDPKTEAGAEFEVTIEVMTYDSSIGSVYIELDYDSEMIEFKSGEHTTLEDGKLIFSPQGDLAVDETLTFRALKNTTTAVSIASHEVKDTNDNVFEMKEGSAQIEIVGGTEVEVVEPSMVIQVLGENYYIENNYLDSRIPLGYSRGTIDIEGETCSVVIGDESDIVLVYLVKEDAEVNELGTVTGRFFMYDEATSIFSPYIEITVSDTTKIAFISSEYTEELPVQYVPTTMTADEFVFPAWEDSENSNFYIVYAITNRGEESLYRYDAIDQSYQRFELEPEVVNPNAVEDEQLQEVVDFVAENLILSVSIIGLLLGFLLLLLLIIGVKLRNRNKELDDIYLEGGILDYSDVEELSTKSNKNDKKKSKKSKKKNKKSLIEEMEEFDEIDEYGEYDKFDDSVETAMEDFSELEVQEIKSEFDQNYTSERLAEISDLGMIDDGMTGEFNINFGNSMVSDGFIEYNESNQIKPEQVETYNSMNEIDKFEEEINYSSKRNILEDDDIEFIDL